MVLAAVYVLGCKYTTTRLLEYPQCMIPVRDCLFVEHPKLTYTHKEEVAHGILYHYFYPPLCLHVSAYKSAITNYLLSLLSMKITEVIQTLEAFAPLPYQENYDNAGLLTGNNSWECTGILCTLDTTEAVVNEAVQRNCNLIVAHHPIIFGGLKKITG